MKSQSSSSGWRQKIEYPHFFVEYKKDLYFVAENSDVKGPSLWKYNEKSGGSLVLDVSTFTQYHGRKISDVTIHNLFSFQHVLYLHIGYTPFFDKKTFQLLKVSGNVISLSDQDSVPSLYGRDFSEIGVGTDHTGWLFMGVLTKDGYWGRTKLELWKYNGMEAMKIVGSDTTGIDDFGKRTSSWDNEIRWITLFDDRIFFSASNGTETRTGISHQLWVWDGAKAKVVQQTYPFEPEWLTPFEGRLYFAGTGDGTGRKLWLYTPDGWSPDRLVNDEAIPCEDRNFESEPYVFLELLAMQCRVKL